MISGFLAFLLVSGILLVLVSAIFGLIYLRNQDRFLKRLESNHHEEWQKLGGTNNPLHMSWREKKHFRVYVKEKEYLSLEDEKLNSLAQTYTKFEKICTATIFIGFGLIVAHGFFDVAK